MAPNGRKPLIKYLICLALAGITLAVFAGVANAGFIVFDDGNYVVSHPAIQHGFSWKTIKWAFSTFDSSNWHPLTWLSLILDYHFFGLNPAGYHLVNLAFHIANTVLLFIVLEHLTARLWPSAFVALLFGIHPMHVESVAWVSERKDVLSAFFFLLTLLAYARYAQSTVQSPQRAAPKSKPGEGGSTVQNMPPGSEQSRAREQAELARTKAEQNRSLTVAAQSEHRRLLYALALFLFALGLMSKPMIVTLPFVLLLLDFWPLRRFDAAGRTGRMPVPLILEKIPFLILSAFSCYFTYLAQKSGGAVRQATEFSVLERLYHVPVSYGWYILKLIWPIHLSFYYELWLQNFALNVLGAILTLVILTVFALWTARKYPYFLFGWLWFLGTMVPVIGLVQVGSQAYADRYTYLPYIGLFIIIAWGIPDLIGSFSHAAPKPGEGGSSSSSSSSSIPQLVMWATAAVIAIAFSIRTIQEVAYWKDGVTLFGRAVELDPKNETALTLLGAEYSNRREYAKAMDSINRALALSPKFYLAWQWLGFLHIRQGDYDRAAEDYENALQYTHVRDIRMNIYNGLGHAFQMGTNYSGAVSAYQSSLAISADQPEVQTALGQCLLQTGQPEPAAAAFQAAVDLEPANPEAQLGLGSCLASAGRDADALGHFRAALQADTNSVMALDNIAWTLAADSDPNLRDGQQAVQLAERACQLTHYRNAQSIGTLAAAYAEAGRFDDAIAAARKAHDVAQAHGEKDIAERNAQLLKLYEAHKAFHMGEGGR